MKKFWLNILWTIIKRIVGDDELIADIADAVRYAADLSLSGAEKKELVRGKLAEVGHDLAAIGNSLVNLAIEAAVALLKARTEARR